MCPEQRRQAAPVGVGQRDRLVLVGERVLDHERVDVDQGILCEP
jgi:hypothetical protein